MLAALVAGLALVPGLVLHQPYGHTAALQQPCCRTAARRARFASPPRASLFDRQQGVSQAGEASALAKKTNSYYEAMQNISAPELISGFADSAPAEVQQAVRSTVVSLLGNLPPHVFDTSVASTGQNIASLMYSMQMTGYMFRNAEYRRSLMESLKEGGGLIGSDALAAAVDEAGAASLPPVSGKIKVKISQGSDAVVEAAAYMSELRTEVER